ncbi:MAG: hypothetical protein HYV26_06770 [Candidatus Hydrogenedentes bacterium]|nr:hypothetical protein [Candidatus Hydrogenedentota bacterium]
MIEFLELLFEPELWLDLFEKPRRALWLVTNLVVGSLIFAFTAEFIDGLCQPATALSRTLMLLFAFAVAALGLVPYNMLPRRIFS